MPAPKSPFRTSAEAWRARRRDASSPLRWDGAAVALQLRAEVAAAEEAGYLDPRLLDAFEAEMVSLVERAFAEHLSVVRDGVGARVCEMVFGDRHYRNRLDRQLATGAAAVAEVVLEEDLMVAASVVAMRLCASRPSLTPAWPVRAGSVPAHSAPATDGSPASGSRARPVEADGVPVGGEGS